LEPFLNFLFSSSGPQFGGTHAQFHVSPLDGRRLKNLAQRYPRAEIAAKLGRSLAAATLKAHELKLSLRMRDPGDEVQRGRGAAGMDLSGPNEYEQNH